MNPPCFAIKGRQRVYWMCQSIVSSQEHNLSGQTRTCQRLRHLQWLLLNPVGKLYQFSKIETSCSKAGVYLLSQWQNELLNFILEQTVRYRGGWLLPTCINIPEPKCWISHPHSSPRQMTDKRAGFGFHMSSRHLVCCSAINQVEKLLRTTPQFCFQHLKLPKYQCKIKKIMTLHMLIIFPGEWNWYPCLLVKWFADYYCAQGKDWHEYFLLFCSRTTIHINLEIWVNNRTSR